MSTIITNDPVWGPQMRAALLAIPTVSLVTNAGLVSGTETKTSMELINPDGSKGFQIDAGAELFGNAGLVYLPKKSIRVSFKGIYGATKLNFDVFGDGATQEFDNLILRGESFDSAFYTNGTDGSYLRSTMTSYLQAGMGDLAPARTLRASLYQRRVPRRILAHGTHRRPLHGLLPGRIEGRLRLDSRRQSRHRRSMATRPHGMRWWRRPLRAIINRSNNGWT